MTARRDHAPWAGWYAGLMLSPQWRWAVILCVSSVIFAACGQDETQSPHPAVGKYYGPPPRTAGDERPWCPFTAYLDLRADGTFELLTGMPIGSPGLSTTTGRWRVQEAIVSIEGVHGRFSSEVEAYTFEPTTWQAELRGTRLVPIGAGAPFEFPLDRLEGDLPRLGLRPGQGVIDPQ